MLIQEAIQLKSKLSDDIAHLILEYNKATFLQVDAISLTYDNAYNGNAEKVSSYIKVRCEVTI